MGVEYIYSMIGTNDPRIAGIYNATKQRVLVLLPLYDIESDHIPDELSYIVDELTIKRFNSLGSEGMESESSDGYSVKYIGDQLAEYEKDLNAYAKRHSESADETPDRKAGGIYFF